VLNVLDMNKVDLVKDSAALRAVKRPITVPVRFATTPGTIVTREGPVGYERGAAICRGVMGEQWPVSAARFMKLYEPLPGTVRGQDGNYRKKPTDVLVKRILDEPFFVNVGSNRQPIFGQPGDWLIQYSKEKRSVIANEVFRASYDIVQEPE
jgi:PGDYG protein